MLEKNETTAIVKVQPQQQAVAMPLSEMREIAKIAASSGLFGAKNETQIIALMLLSQAKGIHPMLALERYDIIQNVPAMKSKTILALFQEAGGTVEWTEATETKCTGIFSHPSGGTTSVTWTIEMARKAGLIKPGGAWEKHPRPMLRCRCVTEGVNRILPGVTLGIATTEDVSDYVDVEAVEVQAVPTPQPAPVAAPDATDPRPRKPRQKPEPQPAVEDMEIIEETKTDAPADKPVYDPESKQPQTPEACAFHGILKQKYVDENDPQKKAIILKLGRAIWHAVDRFVLEFGSPFCLGDEKSIMPGGKSLEAYNYWDIQKLAEELTRMAEK